MRRLLVLHHRRHRRRRHRHRHQHVRRRPPGECAARSDPGPPLHAVARHAADPGGLKEPVTLRLFYSRAAWQHGAGLRHLRRPRAGDAAQLRRALRRQGPAGVLRPRTVQRHRGPRHGLWAAGRAGRSGRRADLFRPRRHQPGGRRAHHPVLPGGPRAVPGIRPDEAGLRAVQPEAAGGRRDVVAAAGRRSAHDDDDAGAAGRRSPMPRPMLLRQTNTVQDRADRRAGDRPRHPGAAGRRGAEPLARRRSTRSTSSSCAAAG